MRRLVKAILLLSAAAVAGNIDSKACTNVIVTRGASTDGSNMVSYAADSHQLYGELYFAPAAVWNHGDMRRINEWDTGKYLGEIPQAGRTYQRVGNMNTHQLLIAETTYGGRPELEDPKGIMDYGSLIYVALERARTAREAIDVIVDLANTYGYYSSGESFSIADKNEVWVMDLIGKGPDNKGIVWVARRVPDGYICAHANQARISTFPLNDPENCMYAPDVISFAREKGYFNGEDKDFINRLRFHQYQIGYSPNVFGCHDREYRPMTHQKYLHTEYVYHLSEYANINHSLLKAFALGPLAVIKKAVKALCVGKITLCSNYLKIFCQLIGKSKHVYSCRQSHMKLQPNYLL